MLSCMNARLNSIIYLQLSEYELSIAAQLVDPTTISITWEDIAGLKEIIQEIRETVILPIQKRELFSGSMLIQPPKGLFLSVFHILTAFFHD